MSMQNITSVDNKIILKAASLKEKKYRELYGLYLIEGKRAVFDALNLNADVECVFIKDISLDTLSVIKGNFEIYSVTDKIMDKICGTVNPQSIAAILRIQQEKTVPINQAVVLDGISDPGNLGTIIRSAAACGIEDIFLCDCTDPYNPKCVRASMGGLSFVRIHNGSSKDIIKYLKSQQLYMMCADMSGENLFESYVKKERFALIIGNEARGVSESFVSACDVTVSLPMQNIESLNAAVCASVMMYLLKHSNNKE